MSERQNSLALSTAVVPYQSETLNVNVSDVFGILRRQWWLPVLGLLTGLTAALTFIAFTPPLYNSSARIVIDRSVNRYLQANKVLDEPTLDDSETGSQIYVMTSESVVIPVVRALKLAADPEFVGKPVTHASAREWSLSGLLTSAQRAVGWGADAIAASDEILERVTVEALLKRLTVTREDVQNVISVTFASEDAKKAAMIANAIADTYIASSAGGKAKSTKMVSQLLQDRLAELKEQAAKAEFVLQDFKQANGLATSGRSARTAEQLPELTRQLTAARVAMTDAKARLDLALQRPTDGTLSSRITDNEVILKLRAQYLDLATRLKEMETRVGMQHAAAGKIRSRLSDLQSAMLDEQKRISTSYTNDFRLASSRYEELTAMIGRLTGGGADSQVQATMRDLEGSAEILRGSYNALLQRYNEVIKAEGQPTASQEARIITRAAPPLRKAAKKTMTVLGGGLAFGLLLGIGAALARELAAGVFRTPDQVRNVTDAYCAILPTVKVSDGRSVALRNRAESDRQEIGRLAEFVLEAPYSRFAESLRNVKAMISVERNVDRGKTVAVVSSVSEEGKTTVLTNLATLIASTSRNRVLVIDGDLHRRHLTKLLAPNASGGLLVALSDPSQLASLVLKNERLGFDLLPCALTSRVPNAAELLGSSQMEALLDAARDAYDFVLIEAPPIMSVADTKMLEHYIDQFIFVIEWGRTKRRLVQEALLEVEGVRNRLACVVLNKTDPAALRSAEAYKGKKFGNYYEG